MSSVGVKGTKVVVPSGVKKTIENIKEITGQNHTDDEIYATLKECSMDPNEALDKLFLLDTLHEVKSKRERRKESQNKEPSEIKWKPGTQSRMSRMGHGINSSRYTSNEAGGGKILTHVKEAVIAPAPGKVTVDSSMSNAQEIKRNTSSSVASPDSALSNGPSGINSQSKNIMLDNHTPMGNEGVNLDAVVNAGLSMSERPLPLSASINPNKNIKTLSSSDPVPVPCQELSIPGAVDTLQREAGNCCAPVEVIVDNSTKSLSASAGVATPEVGTSTMEQKVPNDLHGVRKIQQLDNLPTQSSAVIPSTTSRPSSNYSNRSHVIGSHKVGPIKEWKPKSVIPNNEQGASRASSSEVLLVSSGSQPQSLTGPVALTSKEATSDLQKKLEKLNGSGSQHVIIPNHVHVPEFQKLGFCFGSFDASFGLDMNKHGDPGSETNPSIIQSPQVVDEPEKEQQISDPNASVAIDDTEANYSEHLESPSQEPESVPTVDYSESKKEVAPGIYQNPMPQPVDPSSYYAQFYRSGMDTDGRISPFHATGPANKYAGSATVVSAQNSQNPQEGGVPLVPTASPTPLATQAAGDMQGSMPPVQQPIHVFRQPLPHYNYFPYGPYFSPFYAPPPAFHQFLGSGAFPQQSQPGNSYPASNATTAKYSVPQYKQGPNSGAANQVGVHGSYGPYGLSTTSYNSSLATAPITSTSNEDLAAGQPKENNIYVSGQQTEGSGVWFAAPNRDVHAAQFSSFYNLPQGQLAFAPTQQGHGTFTGIFHPAQTVTPGTVHPLLQQSQTMSNSSDKGGPNSGVYQPPYHAQLNWPGNYIYALMSSKH